MVHSGSFPSHPLPDPCHRADLKSGVGEKEFFPVCEHDGAPVSGLVGLGKAKALELGRRRDLLARLASHSMDWRALSLSQLFGSSVHSSPVKPGGSETTAQQLLCDLVASRGWLALKALQGQLDRLW